MTCCSCYAERAAKIVERLYAQGLTGVWQDREEWRIRWWFFGKKRKQQKQVKIAYPPDLYPMAVCRWKTKEIIDE